MLQAGDIGCRNYKSVKCLYCHYNVYEVLVVVLDDVCIRVCGHMCVVCVYVNIYVTNRVGLYKHVCTCVRAIQ